MEDTYEHKSLKYAEKAVDVAGKQWFARSNLAVEALLVDLSSKYLRTEESEAKPISKLSRPSQVLLNK